MGLDELALKYALQNAVRHGGKADVKAVMGKVLAEDPSLRAVAREVASKVREVVDMVNSMSPEEQRRALLERWPELLEEQKKEARKPGIDTLPDLPEVGDVVTLRFAPNPDFVLTLGNARPAILNYAYKVKYEGRARTRYILRFEDTDPKVKRPLPEAYGAIKEDLGWLGIRWDEEYVQSQRMEVYYSYGRALIERGAAYVDTCRTSEWRKFRDVGKACPHREADVETQLELWDRMLSGAFGEGEAVLRVKTDLSHPDPSVRDWVAFRVVDVSRSPHPLVGDKYVAWPTYNFAVSIDDHLMGITHVLRAQEHSVNTLKQRYVYGHMGWVPPITIHFGRLKIEGATLSKSRLRELGIPWDDIRLPTLAGLRNRGIRPEAIWELILSVGIKPSDATVSMENLYTINRRIIEPLANRYMFVKDPVELQVVEVPWEEATADIPLHPSFPERGSRKVTVRAQEGVLRLLIAGPDRGLVEAAGSFRLMDLLNAECVERRGNALVARFLGTDVEYAKRRRLPIIQWVPPDAVPTRVLRPEKGYGMAVDMGLAERHVVGLKHGEVAQFVRYGFVRAVAADREHAEFTYVHD